MEDSEVLYGRCTLRHAGRMPRTHDHEPRAETPQGHRQPGVKVPPAEAQSELSALQHAAGNAAFARMLDPKTRDRIESALGGGRPLVRGASLARGASPDTTGAQAERVADQDVRLHDDAEAADLSKRLDAVAFTFGRDIFLSQDAPALDDDEGRRLLRHELTHVAQQGGAASSGPMRVSSPDSPAERHAREAAEGTAMSATSAPLPGSVHRQGEDEEEEVMTMPADTVHRQASSEEEELAGDAEAPAEDVIAPQNPALAALFDATILANHRAAIDHLSADPPASAAAQSALVSALDALQPLSAAYRDQDPLLFAQLRRYSNALDRASEQLVAVVSGPRSPEFIRDGVLSDPAFLGFAEGLRDQLH